MLSFRTIVMDISKPMVVMQKRKRGCKSWWGWMRKERDLYMEFCLGRITGVLSNGIPSIGRIIGRKIWNHAHTNSIGWIEFPLHLKHIWCALNACHFLSYDACTHQLYRANRIPPTFETYMVCHQYMSFLIIGACTRLLYKANWISPTFETYMVCHQSMSFLVIGCMHSPSL